MKLPSFSGSMTSVLVSGAVASGLTILIGKLLSSRRKAPVVECVFFSPTDMHISRTTYKCMKRGCPLCNYGKLCALLRTTRDKLDLCMYLITEPELTNIVIRLYKKGVNVRIIADKQMSEDAHKCKSGIFVKHQIPMKYLDTRGMMHNKFFIIDNKVVVSGSCNWTQHGFMSNYENFLIVRDEHTAKQFTRYFNDLWSHNKII